MLCVYRLLCVLSSARLPAMPALPGPPRRGVAVVVGQAQAQGGPG